MKVAINGFGRIGRSVFRAMYENGDLGNEIEVVAINDIVPVDNLAYLLKYDSVQGSFPGKVSHDEENLIVDGIPYKALSIKEGPASMPWGELEVDVVIEATGVFKNREVNTGHLESGAKYVVVTSPADDLDLAVVPGVNDDQINPEEHKMISMTSCTTNASAPVLKVLEKEGMGVDSAFLTTIHSYTATQGIVDSPSPKDFRKGRAAALNIVPSSTGAAKACGWVMPELNSRFDGISLRVPTPTVSLADIVVNTKVDTSYEEIISAMRTASDTYMKGIMRVSDDLIVSSDLIHDTHSSIIDVNMGRQSSSNPRFYKLLSWYDNEWGYSNRVAEVAKKFA